MARMSAWISQGLTNTLVLGRDYCSIYWAIEKVQPTVIICFGIQKKLHFHSKWRNRPKLHRAPDKFQIKFFGTKTTRRIGRPWLLSDFLLPISIFFLAHTKWTTRDSQVTGHKEKYQDCKETVLHEWRKERRVVFWHIWSSSDLQVN